MNLLSLKSKRLFLMGLLVALIIAAIDLYSKVQIFSILDDIALEQEVINPKIEVTSFFNLVKVWNRGVSFGMFNNLSNGKYILAGINIAITICLLIWLYRNEYKYITWALGFIIGGALGNLIDRLQNDAVADFLDFYIYSYHWPAFNVADSAVFIGVALLLLEGFFVKKEGEENEK